MLNAAITKKEKREKTAGLPVTRLPWRVEVLEKLSKCVTTARQDSFGGKLPNVTR